MLYNDFKFKNLNQNKLHSYICNNDQNELNLKRHEKVLSYSLEKL